MRVTNPAHEYDAVGPILRLLGVFEDPSSRCDNADISALSGCMSIFPSSWPTITYSNGTYMHHMLM